MNAFKANDIIICKDAGVSFGFGGPQSAKLTYGKEYKVVRSTRDYVFIVDNGGKEGGWFPSRFEMKKVTANATPVTLLSPQNATIIRHLQRAGSITQREALMDHSIQSLTKRVSELVNKHHYDIRTEVKLHPVTGQRYARYAFAA
jgi:hypothetical protein